MTLFKRLYKELLAIPQVYHFDPKLPIKLETNASNRVITRVYSQEHINSL